MSADLEPQPVRKSPILEWLKQRWFAIVLIIVVVVFIGVNQDETRVNLLVAKADMRIWVLIVVAFVSGIVVGLSVKRRNKK